MNALTVYLLVTLFSSISQAATPPVCTGKGTFNDQIMRQTMDNRVIPCPRRQVDWKGSYWEVSCSRNTDGNDDFNRTHVFYVKQEFMCRRNSAGVAVWEITRETVNWSLNIRLKPGVVVGPDRATRRQLSSNYTLHYLRRGPQVLPYSMHGRKEDSVQFQPGGWEDRYRISTLEVDTWASAVLLPYSTSTIEIIHGTSVRNSDGTSLAGDKTDMETKTTYFIPVTSGGDDHAGFWKKNGGQEKSSYTGLSYYRDTHDFEGVSEIGETKNFDAAGGPSAPYHKQSYQAYTTYERGDLDKPLLQRVERSETSTSGGVTTTEDYRRVFNRDPAGPRFFVVWERDGLTEVASIPIDSAGYVNGPVDPDDVSLVFLSRNREASWVMNIPQTLLHDGWPFGY